MKTAYFTQIFATKSKVFHLFFIFFLAAFLLMRPSSFLQAQDVFMGLASDGGVEGKGTLYSIKTDASKTYTVIKTFADWGKYPKSDLVKGADGAFYGMTPEGGTYNYGTIFRITSSGAITILKHFDVKPDGGTPRGKLIVGKDGHLYGLTSNGGAYWGGVIFRFTPSSGQYTVLKSFSSTADGYAPQGHLVQGTDGSFYGITNVGGAYGHGTIFRYALDGTYNVMKSLNGTSDGSRSYGSLVFGSDGALYGMANLGGNNKYGTIFRITTTSPYSFSVIRHLNGTTDGGYPKGNLILAKDGNLYGMMPDGGTSYNGTIFKINNSGTSFNVVQAMSAGTYGGQPQGSLLQASDGSFYGTAYGLSGGYYGSVFKLTTSGSMSVLRKFTKETDGSSLCGSLVQGSDGLLYGMAFLGGKYNMGTVFKVSTSGTTFNVIAHFNGAAQGNVPQENLAIGKDSAYFGVTQYGGSNGYGTIFKVCGGTTTVIKSFHYNLDGGNPQGGLLRANDGNLYGMTATGGTYGGGTIYKLTAAGSFSVLRHLTPTTDGGSPQGTLIQGTDNYLYGTTQSGGSGYGGTIFKIKTDGSGFTVLRAFVQSTDGNSTQAGLVQASDGNYYGITGYGSRFFKITPTGQFSVVKSISATTEGNNPFGNLVLGTDGALYGTMNDGGMYNGGTIFRITTGGTLTVLRHLTKATDGANPKCGLVLGSDGAFYGTASTGGTYNAGTIFRITTAKSFSVLRHFNMAKDGGTPLSGMIIAPKVSLVANPQSGLTTNEDVAKAITLSGSGATTLSYAIAIAPRNGTVSSGTSASRTYTPKANFSGVDSFAFTTNVGCLASAPAWVKITISPVNDAPVLATIGNKTVVKGSTLTFTATATDPDAGQTKTFSLLSPPSGATINATSGAFSWTPAATGTFTVMVRVTDNGSPVLYDDEIITVTVTAPALTTSSEPAEDGVKHRIPVVPFAGASLYPNPVVSQFTITLKQPADALTITIADQGGRIVYAKQYRNVGTQLQVTDAILRPGAYLVLLQSGEAKQTLKLIKQ